VFSSLKPSSSLITLPPVSLAISTSISLRRSPKPGSLHAADLERALARGGVEGKGALLGRHRVEDPPDDDGVRLHLRALASLVS
jgi:hypothetical protein